MDSKTSPGGLQGEGVAHAAPGADAASADSPVPGVPSELAHWAETQGLLNLALEVSASMRLPDLAHALTRGASEVMRGGAAALALARGHALETVYLYRCALPQGNGALHRLNLALTEAVQGDDPIHYCNAADLVGLALAGTLGWQDVLMVRLQRSEQELGGLLLIANRGRGPTERERTLLQAIAGYAAGALHNARLFSRMAQSNAQWVEVFDAIGDFIVVHDRAGRVLRVNRSMADFIGVPAAELIGLGMRSLLPVAQRRSAGGCPFCGAEQSGECVHAVSGRAYLVSTSEINATLDEGKQTIHVLKDITDRLDAERRYRELFDSIQEGLFFATPEGRFVEVNEALVRMLGYADRDELLAIDIPSELFVAPARYDELRAVLERDGALRSREEILRRKDGSLLHTLQNAVMVRDLAGKIIQIRGLMLDISQLKAFQAELQRQRDFTISILENTQSLILVTDVAGRISYANARAYEVMKRGAGELEGSPLADLVSPAQRKRFEQGMMRAQLGQQVDSLELALAVPGDRRAQFSANMRPMRDPAGRVNSIVVVMSDVTDSLLLQSKLMQTEKMAAVGQLVSGVAHEVNNPLTAILGFADLLMQHPEVPAVAKPELQIIVDEAQRTKRIIQNLLSFSRQMPSQREPIAANELLRRTVALRAQDFAASGIEVAEKLQEPLPEIVGDPHQLQQVLLNILNNAADAIRESGAPGTIEIETALRDGAVAISFRDSGLGIREPQRIFDPFYTTKELGKGSGLGLSICYGIVREHGGEITAANRTDAKGALFTVSIPLEPKAPGAPPQETPPAEGSGRDEA